MAEDGDPTAVRPAAAAEAATQRSKTVKRDDDAGESRFVDVAAQDNAASNNSGEDGKNNALNGFNISDNNADLNNFIAEDNERSVLNGSDGAAENIGKSGNNALIDENNDGNVKNINVVLPKKFKSFVDIACVRNKYYFVRKYKYRVFTNFEC